MPPVTWPVAQLMKRPAAYPAPGFKAAGVRPLFFESVPFHGKRTLVFAWIGFPDVPEGERCPGVVLVHGGDGTAFDAWVRLWNSRGYAAIAMDTCGCVPESYPVPWGSGNRIHHSNGGPRGWGGVADAGAPVEEQWPYHAVAAVIAANSLLRLDMRVDPDRVGITGISWGGVLTLLAAAVDQRFRFAAPVYGCGYLNSSPAFWKLCEGVAEKTRERWFELWDPAHYIPKIETPLLWVTGTNDPVFPIGQFAKSANRLRSTPTLSIGIDMQHNHLHGGASGDKGPPEIPVYAAAMVREETPLPQLREHGVDDNSLHARYEAPRPPERAQLVYTRASGFWQDRCWRTAPAALNQITGVIQAHIPPCATACFFNVTDRRECTVSTPLLELDR